MTNQQHLPLEALYREAVGLADRARSWFDGPGIAWRAALPPEHQAEVATESLATTARLMAVMSWLLHPGHAHAATAGLPVFAAGAGDDRAIGAPLAGAPGGAIAQASRDLVAKVAAQSSLPR